MPVNVDAELVEVIQLPADREKSIRRLRECNITDAAVILELLEFSDEHIEANVRYCIDNYRIAKGQQDIARVTIPAIKKDYAHYQVKLDEEKAKRAEKEKAMQEAKQVAEMDIDTLQKTAMGEGTLATFAKNRLSEIAEAKEKQLREQDYIEMKEYFFQLSKKEQDECFEHILKMVTPIESKLMRSKSMEELWDSVSFRGKLALGTKEYKNLQYEKIQTKLF